MPVFVTQHMPATFTTILAEHLAQASGMPAAEAKDGEPALPGRIYVAPGDFHMVVESQGGSWWFGSTRIRLRIFAVRPSILCCARSPRRMGIAPCLSC